LLFGFLNLCGVFRRAAPELATGSCFPLSARFSGLVGGDGCSAEQHRHRTFSHPINNRATSQPFIFIQHHVYFAK
jgi:hypothetical protein